MLEQIRAITEQIRVYTHAVQCERVRVTCIKMMPDGTQKAFVLDKRDGVTRGFTLEKLIARVHEMVRIQNRGENVYFTPLSEKWLHILVDDLTKEKLDKFLADGFRPAVILETSPGNFQAVITIPRVNNDPNDPEVDRTIANRVVRQLNREYGDPNLFGAIHPHRAPGFENRKPKHQKNGTYPRVRIIHAEQVVCSTTHAIAMERGQYLDRATVSDWVARREALAEDPPAPVSKTPHFASVVAYWTHYKQLLRFLRGRVSILYGKDIDDEDVAFDLSRIDSMIAVRMRVTGHTCEQIAAAVYHCAPHIRPAHMRHSHDWDDYAVRTADYAFSSERAEKQFEYLSRYKLAFMDLERRALDDGIEDLPNDVRDIFTGVLT